TKIEITPVVPKKEVQDIPISRPSHEQIAVRCKECKDISVLFREAQTALGKTIGYDGQSVLIMMYDSYGLPVEVILMAIEYAVSQGKASFSNIAKIGKKWSELEIDSLEGAMEYIEEHNVVNEVWHKLRLLTDITNKRPTSKQFGYLTAWIKEYGYDANMIFYAYEECVDRTGKMSMPYMDKIITSWHKNGVKTPLDIAEERKRWQESQKKASGKKEKEKPQHEQREPSYDIDRFMQKSVDLVYDKNDKNA
ncbi:MAG: DnaD domain protein, partial [Clostridia bacterium]|nr:DnaD domain protein [Clostridia bacterium]